MEVYLHAIHMYVTVAIYVCNTITGKLGLISFLKCFIIMVNLNAVLLM